jgi:hypothetical protein
VSYCLLSKNCSAGIIAYIIFLLLGFFSSREERFSLDPSLDVRRTYLCVLLVSLAKHIAAHGVRRTKPVAVAFSAPVKLNLVMERQSTKLSRRSQVSFLRWLVF